MLARTLLAIAALALASQACAEDMPRFMSITVDNDFFAGYDRHYTNGVQIAFPWNRDVVFAFGQRIYTPADTTSALPVPGERPYAGWLYLLADVRFTNGPAIDHLTATVGVVGPASHARQLQNAFHRFTGHDLARGWDSQLSDELAVTLGYERAWPAFLAGPFGSMRVDLSPRVAATIGNVYTYAAAGVVVRYGMNLPTDLPATHVSLGPPRDGYRGAPAFGWYAWLGLDARAVARNIFLDGNTFRDSAEVDRRPFGYDVQAGIAAAWPEARVGFTFVKRSKEFYGQSGADRFGQLTLSLAY